MKLRGNLSCARLSICNSSLTHQTEFGLWFKLTYNPSMKKLLLLLLFSLGLTSISFAGPYDDWPDDAICMWLEQKPTHAGYLGEAKKRELSC